MFAPSAPRPFRLSESSAQNRERKDRRERERERERGTSKKRLFEAFGA